MLQRILLPLMVLGLAAGWWLVQRGVGEAEHGYVGRHYVLQSPPCEPPGRCGHGFRLVEGSHMEMSFTQTPGGKLHLSFTAGCNRHSVEVRVTDAIRPVNGMKKTQVGCAPELHQQEAWLASFFASAPTMVAKRPYLTLTGEGAKLVLLSQ